MEIFKKVILVILILAVLVGIGFACYGIYQHQTTEVQNPVATIEIEDYGTMKLELYPEQAPNTVANFITLANRGYYDGLTFHRIIEGFMAQGGDVNGDGTGSVTLKDLKDDGTDDEYCIPGEFLANGYRNTLKHEKGTISMARLDYSSLGLAEEGYNSAGAQFFITFDEVTTLDGNYAAFGRVIEGMEVVDKLNETELVPLEEGSSESAPSEPVNPPVITSIRVETYGVEYSLPTTLEPFDYLSWLTSQQSTTTTGN